MELKLTVKPSMDEGITDYNYNSHFYFLCRPNGRQQKHFHRNIQTRSYSSKLTFREKKLAGLSHICIKRLWRSEIPRAEHLYLIFSKVLHTLSCFDASEVPFSHVKYAPFELAHIAVSIVIQLSV